jgi:hypothetical protein
LGRLREESNLRLVTRGISGAFFGNLVGLFAPPLLLLLLLATCDS